QEPEQEEDRGTSAKRKETSDPFREKRATAYSGATLKYSGTPPEKSNKAWWLLLFLIPVIAGGIYIFKGDSGKVPPAEENTFTKPAPEKTVPLADSVISDTIPSEKEVKGPALEEASDTTAIITPDTTKY